MLGDARLAQGLAKYLQEQGIFAVAFSFPVVPKGAARIRLQMSAAHDISQLDKAVAAFVEGRGLLT
jgi:glycine C-acetyltransferase